MKRLRHPRHSHHLGAGYPVSMGQRFYVFLLGPLVVVGVMYVLITVQPSIAPPAGETITISTMISAALYTLGRIALAYILAVVVSIPLALLTTWSRTLEAILLPIFDILESIPILAFFPVLILVFIQFNFITGAAIFILFLNMLWNIVFTIVGGLKIIPGDIKYAAQVFGIRRFSYLRRVILPAIFPQLVTGSILAVAEGWNLIIVAEAVHTYIPGGTSAQDLFGIGSILVQASANAQAQVFITALVIMVLFIGFLNIFVWQRLLIYAQRFRFE